MKKIIASLSLLLAFAVGVNAQEKKSNNQVLALKDASELVDYLKLGDKQKADLIQIFEIKQDVLNNPDSGKERKTEMIKIVDQKIQGIINDPKLYEKLRGNKALYNKISGSNATTVTAEK